jgi:hypothetical protein
MAGFLFGGDTGVQSAAQLQAQREQIDAMRARASTASPQTFGEGLTAIGQALAGRISDKKLRTKEEAERSRVGGSIGEITSMLGGVPATGMGGGMGAPAGAPYVDPNSPGAIGDAAMSALGKPAQPAPPSENWLRYSNTNAIRSAPLDPSLVNAMGFLGDLGVTMDVVSGGQDAAGSGSKRTGSTRHDHGKAADVDFYKGDRKLDWNNPQDLPLLQEIVRNAKANGVTGIGAGDDYMGAGRFHIGFGAPAVWGAGGKSANAPAWLVEAYNESNPQPANYTPGAAPAPQGGVNPQSQGAMLQVIQQLSDVAGNPYASEGQKAVAQALLGQVTAQMQPQDPMKALELERMQLENAQLRNPQPETTATQREYEMARSQGFQGTFLDYQTALAEAKRTQNNINVDTQGQPRPELLGTQGLVAIPDPSVPQGFRVEPAPGSPLAAEREQNAVAEERRMGNRSTESDIIVTSAQRARDAASGRMVGGALGPVAAMNPSSANAELYRQVDVLRSQAQLGNLQAMREASPTGGALGSVTEGELKILADKSGALNPASPNFMRDLDDYERTLLRTIHGPENGDKIFEQTRSGSAPGQDDGFAAFAATPSAIAAAEKYGVTLEEMWAIKQGQQ